MRHPTLHHHLYLLLAIWFPSGLVAPLDPTAGKGEVTDLGAKVRRLCETLAEPGWKVGLVVLDEEGRTLVALDGDQPLTPASNQKILVVGAALGILGPDFRYQTTLSTRDPPREGAIGALVVKGDGDPNISARFHDGDARAIFRAWAGELKRIGVRRIGGDLVVDDSRFDGVRFLPGWKGDQAGSWYSAEVGALNLNDNCVDITVRPARPGEPARVEVSPPTAYVSVQNQCRTVASGKVKPTVLRFAGTNTVVVREAIPARLKRFSTSVTIQDPGLFFGTVLGEVLREEGISVQGKLVRARSEEHVGSSAVVLVRHESSLAEDLRVINKRSQNLHAEVLLKALGVVVEGEGSVEAGGRAVMAFLRREGLLGTQVHVADGSGLAAGNRVSPATLAAVLGWIQQRPFFRAYLESLPVAGRDGTLEKRFRGRRSAGRVFAKTGYLRGVSALSGYVERGGRHWVFAVLLNGLRTGAHRSKDVASARALQEEIADAVYLAMPE